MSDKQTPKVGFVSLGCPKNLVDSEVMLGTLLREGYSITANKEDADVIVVNTCGFIDTAKKESIDTILEMAELKTQGNCKKLVVAGCLAERYRNEIRKEIPEIDFIFGPDELGRILEAVRLDDSGPVPGVSIDALYTSTEVPTIPRILTTPSYLAYLKISEGCDHVCTFCAIPSFRGRFRSRTLPDLVAESCRLAEQGVRELVIVSQDTMAYGKDIGLAGGITTLLRELTKIDVKWVRFLYCYPNMVTDDLVHLIGDEERLCNYFDIPYQHASRSVLERMRRGGHRSIYEKQIESIRKRMPNVGLRTSFIVGFPGETEEEFEEILTFIGNVHFDNVGVFVYSDEEGTAAFDLGQKVQRRIAIRRRNELMKRQAKISRKKLAGLVGSTAEVLLEGRSDESDLLLQGRMETQAPDIDGHVLINDVGEAEPVAGTFYNVEITDSLEYDVIGRITPLLS
jgi:ribosomal protein S12 methylthiotransferase